MEETHKSGFVTMIGRPNVGKSTLLNEMVGEKISIISDKIQTTRHAIQGIYTDERGQVIFIDTPGVHKPKHRLGDYMVDVSLQTMNDVDLILFVVNVDEGFGRGEQFIIEKLKSIQKPVFLILNKVDLIQPDELLPLIDTYRQAYSFAEFVPISALQGNNISTLLELIYDYLPEGPSFFDEDALTDKTERFLVSELIREKVLHFTEEEIPHSINVLVESFKENEHGKIYIEATIITERPSQKGIIIGKQGSMLKKIGQMARKDIEQFLEEKVYLELWVKVEKDWRNNPSSLSKYGFELE